MSTPALKEWRHYVPRAFVSVSGVKLPSPYRDEDEVTMSYETLNKLKSLGEGTFVFVHDSRRDADFHAVLDLIGKSDASIVTFKSFSEGLTYSLRNTPSTLTVVSTDPPAGAVTLVFDSLGKVTITRYELRRESTGFLKTEITDERALNELIIEASTSLTYRILSKLSRSKGIKSGGVKVVNGFIHNPRILDRILTSLKLKNADSTIVEELKRLGYKGNLGAALALTRVAEKCHNGERLVFVSGSVPEGLIILYMKCSGG